MVSRSADRRISARLTTAEPDVTSMRRLNLTGRKRRIGQGNSRRDAAERKKPRKANANSARLKTIAASASPRSLSILAFSDCRSQDLQYFLEWVRSFDDEIDLIVYAGDDCARFHTPDGRNYFELLAAESRFGLAAVIGNDDLPSSRSRICGRRVYDVHSSPVRIGKFAILGLEGAPWPSPGEPTLGLTLYSESFIASHLAKQLAAAKDHRVLIVSHSPPFGNLDSAIRFGRRAIGSCALAAAVQTKAPPDLVICGHVHNEGGNSALLGRTTLVNAASHDGPDDPLRVAYINWGQSRIADTGQLPCWWYEVQEFDQLLAVDGIGRAYAKKLHENGITSLKRLAAATPQLVGSSLGWSATSARVFVARARALLSRRPVVYARFGLPPGPRVFFDIETDPWGGNRYVWLIGCLDERTGAIRQFVSRHPQEEAAMLTAFASHCESLGHCTMLAYSGCEIDRQKTVARMHAHGIRVPAALSESLDLLHPIRKAIAFPTRGSTLEELSAVAGFSARHKEVDGWALAMKYDALARRGRPIPKWMLEYNEDDVWALKAIVDFVEKLDATDRTPAS